MFLELIILALFLNSADAAALNKRGFALGSYNPNTRLTNGPVAGLSRSVWSGQLNQRYKKYDQQRPKTALSYAYDQFDAQHNENILRYLSTSTNVRLPVVVQLGPISQEFYIVQLLGSNDLCNVYEAYMINDGFLDKMPFVLKAFYRNSALVNHHLTDEAEYRRKIKEPFVIVDRLNAIVVYGGENFRDRNDYSLFKIPNFRNVGGLTRSMYLGPSYEYDDNYTNDDTLISFKNFRKSKDGPKDETKKTEEAEEVSYSGKSNTTEDMIQAKLQEWFDIFLEKLNQGKYEICKEMISKLDPKSAESWARILEIYQTQQDKKDDS